MSYLLVCRLDQIAEAAVQHGAREMISLIAPGQNFHRPAVINAERHLNLAVNDIADEAEGLVAPGVRHVERVIAVRLVGMRRGPCFPFGMCLGPGVEIERIGLGPERRSFRKFGWIGANRQVGGVHPV